MNVGRYELFDSQNTFDQDVASRPAKGDNVLAAIFVS